MSSDTSEFDAIVEALGGVVATAAILGRGTPQIYQWRARHGRFPARVYFILQRALHGTGLDARRACSFDDAPRLRKQQRRAG